jgi:hypothetical protein
MIGPMAKIDLRVRDLQSGDEKNVAFEDEGAARAWLLARPRMIEGLGVATHGLDPALSQALKEAMRPLDEDELRARVVLLAVHDATRAEQELAARAAALAAAEEHRKAMREADPQRPMTIHWTYDGGMHLADAADPREITVEARAALLAWIEERNEWVRGRAQIVGEVTLTLWPSTVPAGKERVQQGTFLPVTAPAGVAKPS